MTVTVILTFGWSRIVPLSMIVDECTPQGHLMVGAWPLAIANAVAQLSSSSRGYRDPLRDLGYVPCSRLIGPDDRHEWRPQTLVTRLAWHLLLLLLPLSHAGAITVLKWHGWTRLEPLALKCYLVTCSSEDEELDGRSEQLE